MYCNTGVFFLQRMMMQHQLAALAVGWAKTQKNLRLVLVPQRKAPGDNQETQRFWRTLTGLLSRVLSQLTPYSCWCMLRPWWIPNNLSCQKIPTVPSDCQVITVEGSTIPLFFTHLLAIICCWKIKKLIKSCTCDYSSHPIPYRPWNTRDISSVCAWGV